MARTAVATQNETPRRRSRSSTNRQIHAAKNAVLCFVKTAAVRSNAPAMMPRARNGPRATTAAAPVTNATARESTRTRS